MVYFKIIRPLVCKNGDEALPSISPLVLVS